MSTRCMHLGCPVRYIDAAQRFVCPCHGGVYDFAGQVDGGPPVRPLDRFYTRVAQRPGRGRAALLGQQRVPPLPVLPRSRRRTWTASASTSIPGRFSTPKLSTSSRHEASRYPHFRRPPAEAEAPGEEEQVKPVEQVKEAGISAVDWIDERTRCRAPPAG